MKIKCLIVDDEKPARDLLESYVQKIADIEIVASTKSPLEALNLMQRENIELLLLDIQMPEISGVNLLKCLEGKQPAVIFTTAYQEYALEGYELDIVDYMLKPISFERFLKGVNKAMRQIYLRRQIKPIVNPFMGEKLNDYTILKADHKIHKVKYSEIYFIEGLKEYVTFNTVHKKIIVLETLKNLESTLPSNFLRIHKSFIVNKNWVNSMCGNQLELPHAKVPIGTSYKDIVKSSVF